MNIQQASRLEAALKRIGIGPFYGEMVERRGDLLEIVTGQITGIERKGPRKLILVIKLSQVQFLNTNRAHPPTVLEFEINLLHCKEAEITPDSANVDNKADWEQSTGQRACFKAGKSAVPNQPAAVTA